MRNLDTDDITNWELNTNDEFSELAQILNTIGQRVRDLSKTILQKEQEKETLLLNILPPAVVERWHKGEKIVDRASVAVIVIKVEGLDKTKRKAKQVASAFNELITLFDSRGEQMDVERLSCFGEFFTLSDNRDLPTWVLNNINQNNLVSNISSKINLEKESDNSFEVVK